MTGKRFSMFIFFLVFVCTGLLTSATVHATTSGDAYATQGANVCSWTMGTNGIEKVVTFSGGNYQLTSFKNKLTSPVREYIQGAQASSEFRFTWDSSTYTGSSGGWSCSAGTSSTITVGGATFLQVDVTLTRSQVKVTKHYLIYPSDSIIRESVEYTNTDTGSHTLSKPSFLEQQIMSNDITNLDLRYMNGARTTPNSWLLKTSALSSTYNRVFDSADQFDCPYDTVGSCAQDSYTETSSVYIPWFSIWNRSNNDGVYIGFDYFGRWNAHTGTQSGGKASLSLSIDNYTSLLAPNEMMTSPQAFTGVYKTDLDDMTNRLLDWQYRYLWDYTRDPYFGAIRMLGNWFAGSSWVGNVYDQPGTFEKILGVSDHMRYIGADTYHRDNGWWQTAGDWNGPDFKISGDYLAKYGMKQLIYYYPYQASSSSNLVTTSPGSSWFTNGAPGACAYSDRIIDLSIPAAESWMKNLLVGNATKWGDYQWRNDACFITTTSDGQGAKALAQDQAFRRVQKYFLDQKTGSAIQGVNSGGNDIGYEFLRMASSFSFTDYGGAPEQYAASMLFPVDKLSGIPDQWSPDNCSNNYNTLLMFNPDFTGDTTDPNKMECMRKLVDKYHYLKSQGVAGRWVKQYHPHGTDTDTNWFERLSNDGNKGVLFYKGGGNGSSVTVYPKGLNGSTSYDVRYQLTSGSASRTGTDLMTNGITLPTNAAGEIIYLGLPNIPERGTDTIVPTAPGSLTVQVGVNMNIPGVELKWNASTDNNWVSYYEIFRNSVSIAKVSKGTYYFDHQAGATPTATYSVKAVDGSGNASPLTTVTGSGSGYIVVDDSAAGIVYSGSWTHQTGMLDPYAGTLSKASSCNTACLGFSSTQGSNAWSYQDYVGGSWQNIGTYTASGYQGQMEWHDATGGYVWPTRMHPGPTNDTARTWTAPTTGTIYISSHASKSDPAGNGVKIKITKNGSVIWGGASGTTLSGSDTTGVDANVSSLSVTAGDKIRFEINNNGDWQNDSTTWDPIIQYQAAQLSFTASTGFSNTQGTNGWSYQDYVSGNWQNIAAYAASGFQGQPEWHDTTGGFVWPSNLHPGPSNDTARTWTAPQSGVIDISSHVAKADTGGGNGVKVKITKNGSVIWGGTSGTTIAATDSVGVDANVSGISVVTGDKIRFEVNNNGDYQYDSTAWNPTIQYQQAAAQFYAEYAFTGGSQVTWYAMLGPDEGKASVSIDGVTDTTIDLFAPDYVFNVPIYRKSFASSGNHTIRVTKLSLKNTKSSDDKVNIDGFQVTTASPTGTENTSSAITFSGTWPTTTDSHASGGDIKSSTTANDYAQFTFTGSQIVWNGRTCASCGEADIYIDNVFFTRVDTYGWRGNDQWQVPMFQRSWPTSGSHTIKIVATGTKNVDSTGTTLFVDSFQVR